MQLENQVISLELAKQLKELGVEQSSLFYWSEDKILKNELIVWNLKHKNCANQSNLYDNSLEYPQYYDLYSAFTASELLQILPHRITLKQNEPFNSFRFNMFKSFIVEGNDLSKENIHDFYITNYECDSTECAGEDAWLKRMVFNNNLGDKNPANCLAKVLITLIETKMIEIKND